jgi:hypothetical protein
MRAETLDGNSVGTQQSNFEIGSSRQSEMATFSRLGYFFATDRSPTSQTAEKSRLRRAEPDLRDVASLRPCRSLPIQIAVCYC